MRAVRRRYDFQIVDTKDDRVAVPLNSRAAEHIRGYARFTEANAPHEDLVGGAFFPKDFTPTFGGFWVDPYVVTLPDV